MDNEQEIHELIIELEYWKNLARREVDDEIYNALMAIAEGNEIDVFMDRYIRVENPDFREDDGSDPYLTIDVAAFKKEQSHELWREIKQDQEPKLADGYSAVRVSRPGYWFVKGRPRPKGFISGLTKEQRDAALDYEGPEF